MGQLLMEALPLPMPMMLPEVAAKGVGPGGSFGGRQEAAEMVGEGSGGEQPAGGLQGFVGLGLLEEVVGEIGREEAAP